MAKYGLQCVTPPAAEPVSLAEAQLHCLIDSDVGAVDAPKLQGFLVAARRWAEIKTMRQAVASSWQLSLDGFYNQNLLPRPGVMLSSLAGGLAGWADAWRVWQERGGGWGTMDISTIRLPGGYVSGIGQIVYFDDAGTLQTLPSSNYQLDNQQEPARVVPTFGNVWPTTRNLLNAVQVTYSTGWPHTTLAAPVTAGNRTVTPASMAGIVAPTAGVMPGSPLWVMGAENVLEWVSVSAVTGTTFTAVFAQNHTAPVTVSGVPEELRQAIMLLAAHWYRNREAVAAQMFTAVPMAVDALLDGLWLGYLP